MCIGCCRWSNQRADSECGNIFFRSNPHENVRVRAWVNKIIKLFSKNELDVKRRL